MKIVILDGYTLNPGDLKWEGVQRFGETVIFDRTPIDKVVERALGYEIVLTNKTVIDSTSIEALPDLKYIGVLATGYNVVDIKAAAERNIMVTNAGSYGTSSAAQHTIALILELSNRVGVHQQSVKDGEWTGSLDFCYWKYPLIELSEKTLGIVGLGKIGAAVARIALALGMNVISFHKHPERDKMDGVTFVDLDEIFHQGDFISLHCPLTKENKGFVNKDLLSKMKPTAFLVNTARGPLINENHLAEFLNCERIAGASLDVLSTEPPSEDNPLLRAKNCIITPHIAWASREARQRLLDIATQNIKAFLDGVPQNVVN